MDQAHPTATPPSTADGSVHIWSAYTPDAASYPQYGQSMVNRVEEAVSQSHFTIGWRPQSLLNGYDFTYSSHQLEGVSTGLLSSAMEDQAWSRNADTYNHSQAYYQPLHLSFQYDYGDMPPVLQTTRYDVVSTTHATDPVGLGPAGHNLGVPSGAGQPGNILVHPEALIPDPPQKPILDVLPHGSGSNSLTSEKTKAECEFDYLVLPQHSYVPGGKKAPSRILASLDYGAFPLSDALKANFSNLSDSAEPAFSDLVMAQKVSFRYLPTSDRTPCEGGEHRQPTKGEMATYAARVMAKYITERDNRGMPVPYQMEDLVLISIDVVSKGSVQPRIGVRLQKPRDSAQSAHNTELDHSAQSCARRA
ncbi:hypothetical protein C8Q74DRAFT_1374311 [Fomes fomentarius]|nr:hypothetical protein C8Q74DRAFT_1374311 [Fomes fomentarius]